MAERVLVLALDGATFDVIRPLAAARRLPHLGAWMAEGTARPLRSTAPPMTFPAWSSFMTGLGPGRHGVFDFTQKVPGAYRVRFVNATDRAGASLFGRASRAGRSVLSLGMPATFPPEAVRGLLVSGFDAPVSTGTSARSASDPALYRRIAERVGPWAQPDLDEGARDAGWHERAIGVLHGRIERKKAFALEALRELRAAGDPPDLMSVVFAETDTVGHHFWRDHDPASPRHDPDAGPARRDAVRSVYERLDAACGELRAAFGEDALCLVVSDHGMGGASRRVAYLNRRLEECGLLRRAAPGAAARGELARGARDLALRVLPPRWAQGIFRRSRAAAARIESAARFAGFDWRRTAAFSEEVNTQPGVWLNLRGREAAGCVAPADAERVRREVAEALLAWRFPDGAPVVASARPREEVYSGPYTERAPDVVVELALDAGYGHSLVPTPWHSSSRASVRTLAGDELGGGRGRGMNGTHRPDGVMIATGGRAPLASEGDGAAAAPASIVDVAPTILDALGVAADGADDGVSMMPRRLEYTEEEEALVAARLRALGYLE